MPDDEPTAAPAALLTACKMLLQDCNCGLLPPSLGAIDRVKAAVELVERGEHDAATPPAAAPEEVERLRRPDVASSPDDIRRAGYAVAVHNDYRQNGVSHTFWLFTDDYRAVKGEGPTDAEALDIVRAKLGLPVPRAALAATAPHPAPTAVAADGVDLAKVRTLLDDLRSEVADVVGLRGGGLARVGPESIVAFDALAAEVAALRTASGRKVGE